jgi:hypothetical protein
MPKPSSVKKGIRGRWTKSRSLIAMSVTHHRQNPLESNSIVFLRSVCQLLVTANIVPSSPILVTLMMQVLRPSETSVLTRATWRYIPDDGILHIHRS